MPSITAVVIESSDQVCKGATVKADVDHIHFTDAQAVLLGHLFSYWGRIAKTAFQNAKEESDPSAKRAIEGKGMHYWNCAQELQNLIKTGDLPCHLGFQIRQQDSE